ncbi:hypothetical protein GBA52_018663 [Prunus armeniaca]|nr:hypothetical protein GBA52_018663 [Prunus armeniaca]
MVIYSRLGWAQEPRVKGFLLVIGARVMISGEGAGEVTLKMRMMGISKCRLPESWTSRNADV